jgi:5-formyltetrahydrofolate cyclo-ligase
MDKKEFRQMMHEQRKKLTPDEVRLLSEKIVKALTAFPLLSKSRFIMSYMPYGNEVDIMPLNRRLLDEGKALCVPRVLNGSQMDAVQVTSLDKDFVKNGFGILEPRKEAEPADIRKIDLILVPGVAFDLLGNRLGHGKGFYDRFLESCNNAYTIGIAYDFQVFNNIPCELHDKKMDAVVTESGVLTINQIDTFRI